MKRPLFIIFCACAGWVITSNAQFPILSEFNADSDGWSTVDLSLAGPYNVPLGTNTVEQITSSGNPAGCIRMWDASTNWYYYSAGGKFLGNQSSAYGRCLEYDLKIVGTGLTMNDAPAVVLTGGGLVLVLPSTIVTQRDQWTHCACLLQEGGGWRKATLSGPSPSASEFRSVLASLQALYIRGEYIDGTDVSELDNVALGTIGAVTSAQYPMVSEFTTDAEGWSTVDLSFTGPYNVPLATNTVEQIASSGNPAGCIRMWDSSSNWYYYSAGAKFLGDQSNAYGRCLEYDLKVVGTGLIINDAPAVVLTGGGLVLVLPSTVTPQRDQWTHFACLLQEGAGWRKATLNGPSPSASEFRSVLASLQTLYIRGEYIDGRDFSELDNVALGTTAIGVTNDIIRTAVEIGWPSSTKDIYRVQWTSALESDSWSNLTGIIRGNGSTNSVFDQSWGIPKRFYRILKLN